MSLFSSFAVFDNKGGAFHEIGTAYCFCLSLLVFHHLPMIFETKNSV